jgi:hypothetical protein
MGKSGNPGGFTAYACRSLEFLLLAFLIIVSFLCLNLGLTSIHRDISTNEKWQMWVISCMKSNNIIKSAPGCLKVVKILDLIFG